MFFVVNLRSKNIFDFGLGNDVGKGNIVMWYDFGLGNDVGWGNS